MKNLLLSIFVFFTSFAISQCTHTIKLTDTFGDGWNGGAVSVSVNGVTVLSNITFTSGFGPVNFNFTAATGATIRVWRTLAGSWPSEMRVQIVNNTGTILLNTIQPITGTATTGGYTCIASCSGGGGGGCVNPSAYMTVAAPTTPGVLTISSCTFQSEYNTITGVVAGNQYRSTYNLGGWITVRHTTPNGTVVASGTSPLTWTATISGTYYIHYNTNSLCGTASSCGTTTIECLSCVAPAAPANDLVCNATPIVCGQMISGTTVNATNNGTGENGICSVSQTMPGVWYRVTGNGQIMTAHLCNTAWDSKISVFSGTSCSALTCVGGNDDNGPLCVGTSASYQWTSVVGLNYYILVHGFSVNNSFQLGLTCTTPPPPDPTSITATSNTICVGQSTTLTANGASGTVYWFTGGCGVGQIATGNSISVTPSTTTTYYARNFNGVQFSNNCVSTTVTVNNNPVVSTSASLSAICQGSSTQLNSSVTGVSSPGSLSVTITGGLLDETSWTLTNNLGVIIGSGGPYFTSPNVTNIGSSANGPYVFYIETMGSWNDNVPTFTITCNGSTILTGSIGGGSQNNYWVSSCTTAPVVNYIWSPSTGLSNPNIQNPIANPSTTTTYTVTATSNGCSGTSSRTITVNPLPTVSAGSNQTVCSGTQVTLNGSGASTYSWNNSVTNGVAFTPTSTQTYTVTGTNANGCSNTSSTTVTVLSNPLANAGGPNNGASTCGINQVTLGANTPQAGETGTWSVVSGVGGSFSNINSPTSTFTGNYGSTYTLQWTVSNGNCSTPYNKLVTFNQPNALSLGGAIGTNDFLWGGLTSVDWSTSTNWYQKQAAGHFIRMSGVSLPTIVSQVFTLDQVNGGICIGNTTPTLSVNGDAHDVFINSGITLNLTNDSLNISHDIVNNGTLIANIGTISFVGNQNSSFNGNGTSQLFNMKVNKSQGATLTLGNHVDVIGNLNMIQGNIFTSNNSLLTLGSSSSNIGSLTYNTGTIVGPFKRFFNNLSTNGNEGLFPVGTSNYNRYASFQFTSSPGVNQSLTVQYKTGSPIINGSPLYNGLPFMASNALIQNYSIDGYWEVIPTSNNYSSSICQTPYNLSLFANNLNGMTTPQICRIIKSPGSVHTSWQPCGSHVAIPANANPMAFLITSNNTQGFSWFNIGSSNSQILPVELLSFDGSCNDNVITLNWKTATEHNSHYFEVVKSRDGENWSSLTTVESAGNSTQELSYETKDHKAIDGNNYYKLIQYDTDGQFKEYGPINVICNGNSKGYFSIFPNPSSGDFQVILNNKQLIGDGSLIVKDSKGSVVYTQEVKISQGINLINVSNINLTSGIYYVSVITDNNSTETLKQVIR